MTDPLFLQDSYLKQAKAVVSGHTNEGGIVLDRTVFHPQGGGQPGDSGELSWDEGSLVVATAVQGEAADIILVPGTVGSLPPVGTPVLQTLDWHRRYRHLRIHTALHLLSVVVPFPINNSGIGQSTGWLDLEMPRSTIDRAILHKSLNEFVELDLPVVDRWVTDIDLGEIPSSPNSKREKSRVEQGRARLIQIGEGKQEINRQACNGTHVRSTGEIGRLSVGKIESNGQSIKRIIIIIEQHERDLLV